MASSQRSEVYNMANFKSYITATGSYAKTGTAQVQLIAPVDVSNEDRLSFSTVFGESFAGFTESSAAMPLCFLFPTRNRRGCYGKTAVRRAAFTSFEFRIGTEVAEKKCFVYHFGLPPPEGYHMVQSMHPLRDKS